MFERDLWKKSCLTGSCFAIMLMSAAPLFPGEVSCVLRFSVGEVRLESVGQFTRVTMDGCELTEVEGEPQLPARVVRLVLPPGSRVVGLESKAQAAYPVAFGIEVIPAQPPQPYSVTRAFTFVPPKAEIYRSSEPYPGVVTRILGQGRFAGLTIAELVVHPVAFVPARRQLLLHEEVE